MTASRWLPTQQVSGRCSTGPGPSFHALSTALSFPSPDPHLPVCPPSTVSGQFLPMTLRVLPLRAWAPACWPVCRTPQLSPRGSALRAGAGWTGKGKTNTGMCKSRPRLSPSVERQPPCGNRESGLEVRRLSRQRDPDNPLASRKLRVSIYEVGTVPLCLAPLSPLYVFTR